MPRIVTAAVALLLLNIPGLVHAGDALAPDLNDPAVISAGRQVFLEKHCSHCHGANGDGGVNLTKRDLGDPKYVFSAIADGQERGGLRMPAWRDVLTDAEIWQATAYVMSLRIAAK